MVVKAYRTNLDPNHASTVVNIDDYLSTLEYNTFNIKDVNAGADQLIIEVPRTGYEIHVYNYFVVGGYHYFAVRDVVTTNVYRYNLTRDYWPDLTAITFNGTLTRGHVLASYSAYFVNPVTLTGGTVTGATTFDADPRTYLLVALTYDNGDTEQAALVIVPHTVVNETNIRAEHIVANCKSWANREIQTVVGAWCVPVSALPPLSNEDFQHIMQFDYRGTVGLEVMTATFIGRTEKSTTVTVAGSRTDLLYVGNFGNLTEIPFEGRETVNGHYTTVVDWDACTFYASLAIGQHIIDLTDTARQAIVNNRKDSRNVEAYTNTLLSGVSSAISVVGGIATMNPMAVAGGIMGGAATLANAFTRQSNHQSIGVYGDAKSNYNRYGYATGLCGTVSVRATNKDVNIAELVARGFSGAINVRDTGAGILTRAELAGANGTYLLMTDCRVERANVDENTAELVENVLARGTTLYTEYDQVGQPIIYTGYYGG